MGKITLIGPNEPGGVETMIRVLLGLVLCLTWSLSLAKDFDLTTAVSGVVEKILVKEGSRVKKGQELLILDQRVFLAELQSAEKMLRSAELDYEESKKELERTEELYDRTVISDHELELAKVNFAKADATLADAKRRMVAAQYHVDYSKITAPVSGRVKSINAWVGMVVNNSEKNMILMTVVK